MKNEKNTFEKLLDFILDLVDDEFDQYLSPVNACYYFSGIGCLELAKIIKHFIPSCTLKTNPESGHIAISCEEETYSAGGKIPNAENYIEIEEEEMELLNEYYHQEILFEGKPVAEAVIQELELCTGDYLANLISSINQPPKRKKDLKK